MGYGQLVALLILAYYDPDNFSKVSAYLKEIYHIMGKYSLDSIRTLDVILNVSSQFITEGYKFFIALLRKSDFWPSSHVANNSNYSSLNEGGNMIAANIISFNLSQYNEEVDKENYERYMDMCCILLKNGFVNFYSIWDNVKPEMEFLQEYIQNLETELEEESTKGVENPLAMAAALSTENETDEDNALVVNDDVNMKDKISEETNANIESKGKQKLSKIFYYLVNKTLGTLTHTWLRYSRDTCVKAISESVIC